MSYPDPTAAEAAFYAAFRSLDLEQMKSVWIDSSQMKSVWIDSSGSSCIHPGGGLLQGIDDILASWAAIFRDSTPPRIEHRLIQASTDERLAVHTVQEDINSGSGTRRAVVIATNIYGYIDGGWRMLAHHASLPLVETQTAESQALLH